MSQFSQRVCLVHELGKLAGTEKFLNGGNNRPDINQRLGRNGFHILNSHSFPDNPLHPGQSNAELVLQKFTDTAQAAVSQVIDIVNTAQALHQIQQITDGSHNIIFSQVSFHSITAAEHRYILFLIPDTDFCNVIIGKKADHFRCNGITGPGKNFVFPVSNIFRQPVAGSPR